MTHSLDAGLVARITQKLEQAQIAEQYLHDPARWVNDRTGEFLWSKQREIAEAVIKHRKVAVKACHGPGKSWLASRLAAWHLDTHRNGGFVASTAPTQAQVELVLWREINKAAELAAERGNPLRGRITGGSQPMWKVDNRQIGVGRKPADHNESGFQGIHDDYIFLIIDEATGVVETLWTGSSAILTNDDARALAIGNPDDGNSYFAKICEGAPEDGSSGFSTLGWYVITISVWDTPNFTGEQVPEELAKRLPGRAWVEEKRLEWTEDDWRWQSKIEARFPKDSNDGVLPYTWIRTAVNNVLEPKPGDVTELGIDVAGSTNGDQTVVRERRGMRLGRVWRWREKDLTVTEAKILSIIQETGATSVKIDYGGLGHGLVDRLTLLSKLGKHQAAIHEINFGSRASDPEHYVNLRAELHWNVRYLLQDQAVDFSILTTEGDGGDQVIADLAAPRSKPDPSGRSKVEPKADVSARLKRSPDDGDAVLLAFYVPPVLEDTWAELESEEW